MEESETIQLEIARLQEKLDCAIERQAAAREREGSKGHQWLGPYLMHGRRILFCSPDTRDRYHYVARRHGGAEVRITPNNDPQVTVYFSDMCAFVDGIRAKHAAEEIS